MRVGVLGVVVPRGFDGERGPVEDVHALDLVEALCGGFVGVGDFLAGFYGLEGVLECFDKFSFQ